MLICGKKYTAVIDNGRDYFEFNYISNSRNNSSMNRYDLETAMVLSLGQHSRHYRVVNTYRNNWEN